MNIYNLTIPNGDDIFYNKGFMDVLESHLNYFRTSSKSHLVQVDQKKASIYDGDFFGYLNEANIEQEYHWVIMRVNNFYSNFEFGPGITSIIVPDKNEIEQIRSSYISTGVIIS